MMTITTIEAKSLNCPLCGSTLELREEARRPTEKEFEGTVHTFVCNDEHSMGCECRWTAWDLEIMESI